MMSERIKLRVTNIIAEAKDILVIELRDPEGRDLPAFSPGAHLELSLPNGLIRHYSLCNDYRERDRYCIGVGLARDSRGGSRYIHQALRVGDNVIVGSPPRNNFPMVEDATKHDFIAGGIGITPMLAMIRACDATGQDWSLTYLVRNRQRAAFMEELAPFGARVTIHADDEAGFPDVEKLVSVLSRDSVIYCCGPSPLMKAVESATRSRPADSVRFEWFTPKEPVSAGPREGFVVKLARSGLTITVPPARTILEALEDNGIEAPFACREGICGSCEVPVLAGIPDHRDSVLTAAEQASNSTIMTCCSRALSEELVLDL